MLNGIGAGCCSVRSVLSVTFYRGKTAKYLANSNTAGLSTLLGLFQSGGSPRIQKKLNYYVFMLPMRSS